MIIYLSLYILTPFFNLISIDRLANINIQEDLYLKKNKTFGGKATACNTNLILAKK